MELIHVNAKHDVSENSKWISAIINPKYVIRMIPVDGCKLVEVRFSDCSTLFIHESDLYYFKIIMSRQDEMVIREVVVKQEGGE